MQFRQPTFGLCFLHTQWKDIAEDLALWQARGLEGHFFI